MKVTLLVETKVEKEFDVEFPIYRRAVYGNSTHYTRINADLSADTVILRDEYDDETGEQLEDRVVLEYEEEYEFDGASPDYHLGRGKYHCCGVNFYAALQDAADAVTEIMERTENTEE